MNRWVTGTAAAILVTAVSASAFGQWPPYLPASVPRTPDGKPDLSGPAPRTPDGKPDLSGVWETPFFVGRAPAPAGQSSSEPPLATFFNVGAGFQDGLPLQPWAADLLKKRREDNDKDNPDAHCLPMGLLQFHEHPQPRKIVQTPGLVVIIYEANYGLRQIFLDGRSLPNNDPQPWWYGYSVGRWDGDALVVETTGLRDGGWLDIWGSPLTDKAKLTERFQRLTYGTLRIEVTIDDPKAYTRPFTVRFDQRLLPDGELIEFICNENERSVPHMSGKEGPALGTGVKVDPRITERYVGRYQLSPGRFIVITRKDDQLVGEVTSLPASELLPISDREFSLKLFDSRLTFEVDERGRATAVIWHTDSDQRAPRVE